MSFAAHPFTIMNRLPWFTAPAMASCVFWIAGSAAAKEDIEFVAEHLPEVAMDNRYATLPLWGTRFDESRPWSFAVQAAWSQVRTGELEIKGPMLSAAVRRDLSDHWSLNGFVFFDDLRLTAASEERQLQTLFAPDTPFSRPVAARFTNLDGTAADYGVGFSLTWRRSGGWLGEHHWVGGVLWQKVALSDYRLDYQLLEGPSAGVSGQVDFDADYSHVTPFIGFELPRRHETWSFSPHALFALPLPQRGVVGHITGPDFDLHGDTAEVGNGKHFGDPSLTLGLDVTYEPLHLSVDVGTTLTQWLFEPLIHKGIDQNWVLSARWQY